MQKGIVYLVGAGPGDPELLTIKALNVLRRAEVVLYDSLIPFQLLKEAPANAELISVGKRAGNHRLVQEKINSLLLSKARAAKLVVRLKGGDPFLFGRGAEEALFLQEAGVEVKVIPGVSSSLAAALAAGIPLTHRKLAKSVAIISGSDSAGEPPAEIPKAETLIFLMPKKNLPQIAANLITQGFSPALDAALIENGTKPNQRMIQKKLAEFAAGNYNLKGPAIFIVGKTVSLATALSKIYEQHTSINEKSKVNSW